MMLDARHGRGCSHCEGGTAMAWFAGRGTIIALCIICLVDWFPGRSVEWIEERLDHYSDHIGYKFARIRAQARDEPIPTAAEYATKPEYDPETGRWTAKRTAPTESSEVS